MTKKKGRDLSWLAPVFFFTVLGAMIFWAWSVAGGETLLGVKLAKEDCGRLGGEFTWSERWVGRYTYSCEFKKNGCEAKKDGDGCECRSWSCPPGALWRGGP